MVKIRSLFSKISDINSFSTIFRVASTTWVDQQPLPHVTLCDWRVAKKAKQERLRTWKEGTSCTVEDSRDWVVAIL